MLRGNGVKERRRLGYNEGMETREPIIGFEQSGRFVVLTDADLLSDPSRVASLRFLILDYRGERIELLDGRFLLMRVVFLSGLDRNLAVYRVHEIAKKDA